MSSTCGLSSANSSSSREKQITGITAPAAAMPSNAAASPTPTMSMLVRNILDAAASPQTTVTPVVMQHVLQGKLSKSPETATPREVDLKIYEPVIVHTDVYVPKAIEQLTTMLPATTEIKAASGVTREDMVQISLDLNKDYLLEVVLKQIKSLSEKNDTEKIKEVSNLLEAFGPKVNLRPYLKYRDDPDSFNLLKSLVATSQLACLNENLETSAAPNSEIIGEIAESLATEATVKATVGAAAEVASEAVESAVINTREEVGVEANAPEAEAAVAAIATAAVQEAVEQEVEETVEQKVEGATVGVAATDLVTVEDAALEKAVEQPSAQPSAEAVFNEDGSTRGMFESDLVYSVAKESLKSEITRVLECSKSMRQTQTGEKISEVDREESAEFSIDAANATGNNVLVAEIDLNELMRHLAMLLKGEFLNDVVLSQQYEKMDLVQRAALHNSMQVLLSKNDNIEATTPENERETLMGENERVQLQRGVVSLLQSQASVMEREFAAVESDNLEEGGEDEVIRSIEVLMEADIQPEVWRERFCTPLSDQQREVMHRSIIAILKTAEVKSANDFDEISASIASTDSVAGHAKISEWQKHNLEMGILALVQTEFTKLSSTTGQTRVATGGSANEGTAAVGEVHAEIGTSMMESFTKMISQILMNGGSNDATMVNEITLAAEQNRAMAMSSMSAIKESAVTDETKAACDQAIETIVSDHGDELCKAALASESLPGLSRDDAKAVHKTAKYLFKENPNVEKWARNYSTLSPEMQMVVKYHLAVFLDKSQTLEKRGQAVQPLSDEQRALLIQARNAIAKHELENDAAKQDACALAFGRISDEEKEKNRLAALNICAISETATAELLEPILELEGSADRKAALVAHLRVVLAIGFDLNKIPAREFPLTEAQRANIELAIRVLRTDSAQPVEKVEEAEAIVEGTEQTLVREFMEDILSSHRVISASFSSIDGKERKRSDKAKIDTKVVTKIEAREELSSPEADVLVPTMVSVPTTETTVVSRPPRYAYSNTVPAVNDTSVTTTTVTAPIAASGSTTNVSYQQQLPNQVTTASTSNYPPVTAATYYRNVSNYESWSPTTRALTQTTIAPEQTVFSTGVLPAPQTSYSTVATTMNQYQQVPTSVASTTAVPMAVPSVTSASYGVGQTGAAALPLGGSVTYVAATQQSMPMGTMTATTTLASGAMGVQQGSSVLYNNTNNVATAESTPINSPRWVWRVDERYRTDGPLSLSEQFSAATGINFPTNSMPAATAVNSVIMQSRSGGKASSKMHTKQVVEQMSSSRSTSNIHISESISQPKGATIRKTLCC